MFTSIPEDLLYVNMTYPDKVWQKQKALEELIISKGFYAGGFY